MEDLRDRSRDGEERRNISNLINTFEREGRRGAREAGLRDKERGLRPDRDGRRSISPFLDYRGENRGDFRDRAISTDRNRNGRRSPSPYQDDRKVRDEFLDKRERASPARNFRKESELEIERQEELDRKIKSIEEAETLKRERRSEERLSDSRSRKNSSEKEIKSLEIETKTREKEKETKSYEKYSKSNDSKSITKTNHDDSYNSYTTKERKREMDSKTYRTEKDMVRPERKLSEKDKMLKVWYF